MRLLPRVLALAATFAILPAAHAACTAATIKGYFAASSTGSYSSLYPTFGVAHLYFNGINAVSVSSFKEGRNGDVATYTGYGSYQIDQYCRGTASIGLKQNGVAVGTLSLAFTVSGTPASPRIHALVSNPANDSTGGAIMDKINL